MAQLVKIADAAALDDLSAESLIRDTTSGTYAALEDHTSTMVSDAIAASPTVVAAVETAAQNAATTVIGTAVYHRGTLASGTDLNTLTSPSNNGIYSMSGSNTYPNSPFASGVAFSLVVENNGLGVVKQTAIRYSSGLTFERFVNNAFANPITWREWVASGFARDSLASGKNIDQMIGSRDAGAWRLSNANTYAGVLPMPSPNGELLVIANGYGSAKQIFYPYQSNDTYERSILNFSTFVWTAWEKSSKLTIDEIVASLGATNDPARLIAPAESLADEVTMWGDSLTHAGGVVSRLQTLMPAATVTNRGVSGQTAGQVAARQGGGHSLLTLAGDSIPASGAVAVTARTQQLLAQTGYPARSETGTLAGIHGTLSNAEGSTAYTFTRTTPGEATACPPNTPFVADVGKAAREHTQIIWAGRNNPETGVYDYDLAMAAHLSPATKRFLILSVTNTVDELVGSAKYVTIMGHNNRLAADFGNRFLDIRAWLIANGLQALGITPTADDTTAINGDAVPPSLTTDKVHFTSAAQSLIGDRIHARLVELGWA